MGERMQQQLSFEALLTKFWEKISIKKTLFSNFKNIDTLQSSTLMSVFRLV